jgi:hypothetical protein
MAIPDLFGDTTGLPRTWRGVMPYQVEALTPREVWGHGHGTTNIVCTQTWENAAPWMRYMLGEWEVFTVATSQGARPDFVRHIPEPLRYGGNDLRVQWCTGLTQTEQGGNPVTFGQRPEESTTEFATDVTNWPRTAWCKYQGVWETTPYVIRTYDQIIDLRAQDWGTTGPEPIEFLRYVVRSKRTYSKEQPIPAASPAGGFKVIDDAVAANRKVIGQTGFRVISMADVSYKWMHTPAGWPPPAGWTPTLVPGAPPNQQYWPPLKNPAFAGGQRTRDSYVGKINSVIFDYCDPEGYCFPAGTLLYTGWSDEVFYNEAGQRTANVTYNFKFKEAGWNKFLSARGEWKEVSLTGLSTGTKPYETADFRKLFEYVSA